MKFHEAFARALADNGVTTVFGLMGDANLFAMDSFVRHGEGEFCPVAHEAAAVLAANGYAKVTGGIGVASVTHGPALTNTLTALVESVRDRTPVLLLAGDTAATDRDNFQNISQRDVVMPTGAGFEQLRAPSTLVEDLTNAIRRARTEKRPVVLNIPSDFQWQDVDYAAPTGDAVASFEPTTPSGPSLQRVATLLAEAKRPVVLAGRGAIGDAAREHLVKLAGILGAPLATTLQARDLFRDEPHNLGICGGLAHDLAKETILSADCIIAFGASLNKWTTFQGALTDGKVVIQVDNDASAFGRFRRTDEVLLGDSAATAEALTGLLNSAGVEATDFASSKLAQKIAQRVDTDFEDMSTQTSVDHRTAALMIDAAFPPDRKMVFDAGRFVMHCYQLFHVAKPQDYLHALNFGSIGLSMGTAIGAAKGSGKPTLLVTGDGGFMLGGITEFNTAVRLKLDIVVVMFNDRAYGAEHIQFLDHGMDPSLSMFEWPDFGPVADALGGKGYTVRNLAELEEVLNELPQRDRPVLIDIRLDPDRVSMLPIGH